MVAIAATLTSCEKDLAPIAPVSPSEPIYVSADIHTSPSTRVTMESITEGEGAEATTIVKLDWALSGETFDVVNSAGTVVATFEQTVDANDAINQFEGTLTQHGEAVKEESATYTIVYPSAEAISLAEQSGELDGAKVMMCGTYTGTLADMSNISFTSHQTAIIKLFFETGSPATAITSSSIHRIVVTGLNNSVSLAGGAQAGDIEIEPDELDDIYLFVPATAAHTRIGFKVYTSDAVYDGSLSSQKAIEAGKHYMAKVTLTQAEASVFTSSTQPSTTLEGAGTAEDPYLIQSAEDLLKFMGESVTENPATHIPAHYQLNTDIKIAEGTPWIFAVEKPFADVLDGNNKTVSGKINGTIGNMALPIVGFIGQNAGVVKDLNIAAEVVGSGATTNLMGLQGSGVGAVAGVNMGTIENCTSTGSVSGGETISGINLNVGVGGIAGVNLGDITNSTNNATIKGTTLSGAADGWSAAGGVVGISAGGEISDCANNGNVTAGEVASGESLAAGILGFGVRMTDNIVVSDCTNSGTISGSDEENDEDSRLAGIVGSLSDVTYDQSAGAYVDGESKIVNCTNSGAITGGTNKSDNSKGDAMIAGIVAYSSMVDIIGCTNAQTATITAGNTPDANGWSYVGGVVAIFIGDAGDEYFMKDAVSRNLTESSATKTTISDCKNFAAIIGAQNAGYQTIGGIIGDLQDGHIIITDNENQGSINANGSASASEASSYVGGIIGRGNAGWAEIFKCVNSGNITGSQKGRTFVGGITGDHSGRCVISDHVAKIPSTDIYMVDRIYDCVNNGTLTVPATAHANSRKGGIAGSRTVSTTDSTVPAEICSCCVNNDETTAELIGVNSAGLAETVNGCHGCDNASHGSSL